MSATTPCPIDCPVSEVDPWSADVLADPYPTFRRLRDLGPVVWLARYGLFALTRFDEVRAALSNWERFSSAAGVGVDEQANAAQRRSILNTDPPVHDTFRRPVAAQLSTASLAREVAAIEAVAARLADAVVARGEFDAVADVARPLSLDVVCDLVGIPEDCRAHLPELAEAAFNVFGPANELLPTARPALRALEAHAVGLTDSGRLAPGRNGAELVAVGGPGALMTYTWPGIDTTVNGVSAALHLLARHPEQWQVVRDDPSLIPGAFLEALRMHAPVHYFTRRTTGPAAIGGVVLPPDVAVLVMYGSANRDERHYADPDRFDVARNPLDQLAFGRGVHVCVGMHLAKLEGQAILAALARRVARFEPAGEPTWLVNNTLHGLRSLPLRAHPA